MRRKRSAMDWTTRNLVVESLEPREYLSVAFTDSTVADFAQGIGDANTYLAATSNGELMLAPQFGSEFSAFPRGWTTTLWRARGSATASGERLELNRAALASDTLFSSGRSIEFAATFTGEAQQRVGMGRIVQVPDSTNRTGFSAEEPPFLAITTAAGGQLFAVSGRGRRMASTPLGDDALHKPHRFRIDWGTAGVVFSIDGAEVARHTIPINRELRLVASDLFRGTGRLAVDWIRVTPFAGSAAFQSRVFDAGESVDWGAVTWGASIPTGTAIAIQVRTGESPDPTDDSWTGFRAIELSGTVLGVASRYLHYRVEASSANPHESPALRWITVEANATDGILASVELSAGWATFGQVLPAGAAYGALQVGDLSTQSDVKTRWPDGSIRFAVLTARVPAPGVYAVTQTLASDDSFVPSWPSAQVTFGSVAGSSRRLQRLPNLVTIGSRDRSSSNHERRWHRPTRREIRTRSCGWYSTCGRTWTGRAA